MQAGTAALLALAPAGAALANEFDLLNEPRPTNNYVIDDANVLNKTTKKALNYDLQQLEVCGCARMLCGVCGKAPPSDRCTTTPTQESTQVRRGSAG